MSRIGNKPVNLPAGVTVNVTKDNVVSVKGPLGELVQRVDPDITVSVEGSVLTLSRPSEQKRHRSLHGLYRALIYNMVYGVSKGWELQQELIGVGFKAELQGNVLQMSLGFSHDIHFMMPPQVTVEAKQEKRGNPIVTFRSPDKQLLGMVAAKLRSIRPPEPYKGKGIRFVGEEIRRKAGKKAQSK